MIKKNRTFIIAEAGNNHEGSFINAKKLITQAAKAKVDAVKFQTFITDDFINNNDKKRFKRFKKFQLSQNQFIKLAKHAHKRNLKFISTPFDIKSAEFLNKIVDAFKISSGDNNYFELIKKVLSFKKYTIISTGFLNYNEILKLIRFIKKIKFPLSKLTLLHCVSAYPVNINEANLRSIIFLKKKLNISIGYSDHTIGNLGALTAACLGADIIEKHFTLDHNFSNFRDHKLSAEPQELKILVSSIRKIEILSGKYHKKISKSEKFNQKSTRRSIYVKSNIDKNEIIKHSHLKVVRPEGGIKPNKIKNIIGKKTNRKLHKHMSIKESFLI